MPKLEITNMVMVQDVATGKVVVQEHVKSWCGISFPGGHAEPGESIYDSAIREIKEETGLDIKNLISCGLVHWSNNKTFDRYLIFLFKTSDYSGELMSESDEGKNFWITIEELKNTPSDNSTPQALPMFLEDKYSEAFGSWNDNEPWEIVYK